MTETPRLSLPLLAPSQAQKHVTVNEALARIDALAHLTLVSISQTAPPAAVAEGDLFAVPPGGAEGWVGQDGKLAMMLNGGWVFVPPKRGWRAMVLDQGAQAIWDGAEWRLGAMTLAPSGAGVAMTSQDVDVPLTPGASVTTPVVIAPRAIVFGVTGRVVDPITGTATHWDLGVAGDAGRFGTGLGLPLNSWVNGPAAPIVYWDPTALVITARGGVFAGGMVRLTLHCAHLGLPMAV